MMRKKGMELTFLIYWFLLVYIISALIWWFISLTNQSNEMATYKEQHLQYTGTNSSDMQQELAKIRNEKKRNSTKFIAEGITFLLVIFVGAVFIYRSVRRQLRMQHQQQN